MFRTWIVNRKACESDYWSKLIIEIGPINHNVVLNTMCIALKWKNWLDWVSKIPEINIQ